MQTVDVAAETTLFPFPVAHAHRHWICRPAGPESQTERVAEIPTRQESAGPNPVLNRLLFQEPSATAKDVQNHPEWSQKQAQPATRTDPDLKAVGTVKLPKSQ